MFLLLFMNKSHVLQRNFHWVIYSDTNIIISIETKLQEKTKLESFMYKMSNVTTCYKIKVKQTDKLQHCDQFATYQPYCLHKSVKSEQEMTSVSYFFKMSARRSRTTFVVLILLTHGWKRTKAEY